MCLGTAATIGVIAAGASAGASIYGANKQAGAAKEASQQQQASAQQAQQQTAPLYNQALQIAQQQALQGQARLDPYAAQGQQGLTALSKFLGVPQAAPVAPAPVAIPHTAEQAASAANFGPTAARNQQIAQAASTVPMSPANGRPTGTTVVLRAPDGSTQAVPISQAQFYLSRGATRI